MRKYYLNLCFVLIACIILVGCAESTRADFDEHTEYSADTETIIQFKHSLEKMPIIDNLAVGIDNLIYEEAENYHIINGVSLFADKEEVLQNLGDPIEITRYEDFIDYEDYHYDHMTISFSRDLIQNIAISTSVKEFEMGNRIQSTDPNLVDKVFGPPELESEDGILYSKADIYIKLFYKPDTTEIDSIHFFTEGI